MKRWLKRLSMVILLALVGLVVFAATRPDQYTIMRSAVIPAPPTQVWALIGDIRQWERWSPWKHHDPSVRCNYSAAMTGVGAQQDWTSDKSGSGTLLFTGWEAPSRVVYELYFKEWDSTARGEVTLAEVRPGQTEVTWVMHGQNNLLGKIFFVVLGMEGAIAQDFDLGLSLMKEQLPKNQSP